MSKSLTISIVTYNAQEDIEACLRSLLAQREKNFDVLVVDNASQDDTVARIQYVYPSARIIQNKENRGFGAAHNQAIAECASGWVLLLNQDLTLEPDMIECLMQKTWDERIASVGPLLLREKGKDASIDTTGLVKLPHMKVVDRQAGIPLSQALLHSSYVWGISGACVMYRKDALEKVAYPHPDRSYPEYFDEAFFMYKEDVDLAHRLREAGYKAWFESSAVGYHRRSGRPAQTFQATQKQRQSQADYIAKHSYKNHLYYLLKHAPLFSVPLVASYELSKLGYLALFERQTLSALPAVFEHAGIMLQRRYGPKA